MKNSHTTKPVEKIEVKGFSYYIGDEMLKEYSALSVEKKLAWLHSANVFENGLSAKVRILHEKFRKAKM